MCSADALIVSFGYRINMVTYCFCCAFNIKQLTRHSNGQITVGCRSCLTILANYHLPLNGALCVSQVGEYMDIKSPQLTDGTEWIEHEDCIVGDEQGLINLISACEKAIEDGEYYGDGLGNYVGVKKLDTSVFVEPENSPSTKFGLAVVTVVFFGLLALVFVGGYTALNWLFS